MKMMIEKLPIYEFFIQNFKGQTIVPTNDQQTLQYVTFKEISETYSEPIRTSTIKFFATTIFTKHSMLDVWKGSVYVSQYVQDIFEKYVKFCF